LSSLVAQKATALVFYSGSQAKDPDPTEGSKAELKKWVISIWFSKPYRFFKNPYLILCRKLRSCCDYTIKVGS